ncbi:replication protein A 70 kDa DNA-binding subunit E [Trifolium repens]|nr:replication protein A 70 kDa DNA-binding subunit E [Trifolium repens]
MSLSVANGSEFSNISEINSDKAAWDVKVKIIRLWQVSDFNRSALPFSIEMVLLDANGDRIHATVKKTLIYKFKDQILEGKIYALQNVGVSNNGGAYRTTRHPYKMNFLFNTFVQRISNFDISKSPFHFVPISEIVGGSYDTDYLCDVMGVLTGVGQEREVTNQNGSTTKLNVIALEANGSKIQCTLFGNYVDELNAFLGAGDCNNAVVILQFAKAKNFQDKIHIQNCMNCSLLIFNSSCAESVAFKSSLAENVDTPSPLALTQIGCESRIEPIDEFLHNTRRITLQCLRDAGSEGFHVVAATIKKVLNPDSFWYTACVCNKAVIPDSKMFYCEKCNKHVVRVFPRFCIKVRVMDNTDSAIFVIFDKDASSLFDLSCADMVQALESGARAGVVPALFEALVDKTWLFKVESKANHNQRFEQSFRVRKLCTDAAIIQQFKEKWDNEEAAVGKKIYEHGSLSTLVGKGKDMLVGGSSNVLNEDCESLSASDVKGKGVLVEPSQVGEFTQDLMNKFADAVVDLGDDSSPVIGSTKFVPDAVVDLGDDSSPVIGSTKFVPDAVVDLGDDSSPLNVSNKSISTMSEKTPVSVKSDEGSTLPTVKGLRKKSVAKRVSPKNDEGGEDDNAPIKLLKRPIKIEKI